MAEAVYEHADQKPGTVGIAFLITNCYNAKGAYLSGTIEDHDRWLKALWGLNFDVRWERNLTADLMKSFMKEIEDVDRFDGCKYTIFVFSGHGNATSLLGQDRKAVQCSELLKPLFEGKFQASSKLIFLDACRTKLKPDCRYDPEALVPSSASDYYLFCASRLDGQANEQPEGSQFSKAVTECIVGDCTIAGLRDETLWPGRYKHVGEDWPSVNNLAVGCGQVKLKDLLNQQKVAASVPSSIPSLPSKTRSAVEVPTAPRAGMDEEIVSSADILGVSKYKEGLIGQMLMLGTALGIGGGTVDAILNSPGSNDDHLVKIVNLYIREESPTWRDFCTALKKYKSFNNVRDKIEADHY